MCKDVLKGCFCCQRLSLETIRQPLPSLHESRTANPHNAGDLRAFLMVGLDFAGPYHVQIGRTQHKCYLALIACCSTRALNVEICHALTAQSCLAALERHCARYGTPRYVNSDNESNFLASAAHLEERINLLRQSGDPWKYEIEWTFNPACAPTYTGHIETMVKMVKEGLRRLSPRH